MITEFINVKKIETTELQAILECCEQARILLRCGMNAKVIVSVDDQKNTMDINIKIARPDCLQQKKEISKCQ